MPCTEIDQNATQPLCLHRQAQAFSQFQMDMTLKPPSTSLTLQFSFTSSCICRLRCYQLLVLMPQPQPPPAEASFDLHRGHKLMGHPCTSLPLQLLSTFLLPCFPSCGQALARCTCSSHTLHNLSLLCSLATSCLPLWTCSSLLQGLGRDGRGLGDRSQGALQRAAALAPSTTEAQDRSHCGAGYCPAPPRKRPLQRPPAHPFLLLLRPLPKRPRNPPPSQTGRTLPYLHFTPSGFAGAAVAPRTGLPR